MTMFLKTLANRFYLFHKDWIVDCVLLLPLNSTGDIFQITSKIDLLFQKWKPRTEFNLTKEQLPLFHVSMKELPSQIKL